jgi:hypothetical protein
MQYFFNSRQKVYPIHERSAATDKVKTQHKDSLPLENILPLIGILPIKKLCLLNQEMDHKKTLKLITDKKTLPLWT